MKALRYLLIIVAVMGVLGISAQTPNYGKPYQPSNEHKQYNQVKVYDPAPTVAISSTSSDLVQSGSTLPSAAVSGTYVTGNTLGTYTSTSNVSRPRRVGEGEGTEDEEDPDNPGEPSPIGDAGWPLLMLAVAYALLRVYQRKRRV